MKVSFKLYLGFMAMILLILISGIFGYAAMNQMNQGGDELYRSNVKALEILGNMRTNIEQQRVYVRDIALFKDKDSANQYINAKDMLSGLESELNSYMLDYEDTISDEDMEGEDIEYEKFYSIYKGDFKNLKNRALSGESYESVFTVDSTSTANEMTKALNSCFQFNTNAAKTKVEANTKMFTYCAVSQAVVGFIAIVCAFVIAFTLNRSISKPLEKMVEAANTIAKGNMDIEVDFRSGDEVGKLAEAFRNMASNIKTQAGYILQISTGDLTPEVELESEMDIVGISINTLGEKLNGMVRQVVEIAGKVSSGTSHVSDGSHSLAQGGAEQATAVEQLSSSVYEISLNAKENAKMAEKAAELYSNIEKRAKESSTLMAEMMQAVAEINEASKNISKIMKLINDISFQTNILSINAAVEAANAGAHGKGFGVVAGEVRNLASKSAQAANDTDSLIENSLKKAQLGANIADKTYTALNKIVEDIIESSQLISDIAKASGEQSLGVDQINIGIEQVAQVINMTTSTAEKSALAAAEIASQASQMEKLVSSFRLRPKSSRGTSSGDISSAGEYISRGMPKTQQPAKDDMPPVIILEEDSGKY